MLIFQKGHRKLAVVTRFRVELPLSDVHRSLGARMMTFGDWQVPLNYGTGAMAEHRHVRERCGLFDVSHMGQIEVRGKYALPLLQYATCNDVARLAVGRGHYTAMLNDDGGFLDDMLLYRVAENFFMLCVNAVNVQRCMARLQFCASERGEGKFAEHEAGIRRGGCLFALQGPESTACLRRWGESAGFAIPALRYLQIVQVQEGFHLARSGYTGEVGYELYLPEAMARDAWHSLLAVSDAVRPIGFSARDMLRLEAGYLLYGNDIDECITPFEAGVGWIVKFAQKDFAGKDSLSKLKQVGAKKKLVVFRMVDRGFPRQGMEVCTATHAPIGRVSSGSVLPTVGGFGGFALLNSTDYEVGDEVFISNRGKYQRATIVDRPLYRARCKD